MKTSWNENHEPMLALHRSAIEGFELGMLVELQRRVELPPRERTRSSKMLAGRCRIDPFENVVAKAGTARL